jgi:hypothetical protein
MNSPASYLQVWVGTLYFKPFITQRGDNVHEIMRYKTIIIPIWTYGLELWGCASKSNISIIQRSQSKILRMIDAPWYDSNAALHDHLGISYLQDSIHQKCNKHPTTLETHENPLLKTLLVREENRRHKRN